MCSFLFSFVYLFDFVLVVIFWFVWFGLGWFFLVSWPFYWGGGIFCFFVYVWCSPAPPLVSYVFFALKNNRTWRYSNTVILVALVSGGLQDFSLPIHDIISGEMLALLFTGSGMKYIIS